MPSIRYLGHASWELSDGGTTVLVDPWLEGNPKAAASASDLAADAILLTHGHLDHFGDTVDIAKRTGAQVVAIVEIANELQEAGVENVSDPNIGGTVDFGNVSVRLTPAWHTSTTPNGTVNTPAGLLVKMGDATVYHLGDTGLFSDLQLVKAREGEIDVALMCIGGHYTMDRLDAVAAAQLVGANTVIPCHYNTFPPIETDAEAFKNDVTSSEVVGLDPGDSHAV
jgi:L-ascorbate metabolism protein UlaG (beta-lactamase superfamily)